MRWEQLEERQRRKKPETPQSSTPSDDWTACEVENPGLGAMIDWRGGRLLGTGRADERSSSRTLLQTGDQI